MSMRKGWPIISIITGILTLIVIWLTYSLISSIELSRSQMMARLYESPSPMGHYYSTLDTANLFILTFAITMLLCGIIATLTCRPSDTSLLKGLYPPLLAASVPLITIGLFVILSFINNSREFYQGNHASGPYYPMEPPFLPVYLLIMAIITIPGLVFSIAGGILVWLAINSGKS